jgi:hypothetical protein
MKSNGQHRESATDHPGLEQWPARAYYSFRFTQFGISLPGALRHASLLSTWLGDIRDFDVSR